MMTVFCIIFLDARSDVGKIEHMCIIKWHGHWEIANHILFYIIV
jgi:hypothetical protein